MIELDLILSTKLINRAIFSELKQYLFLPEAIVITGPRQSGKTSLLYMIAQHLVREGYGKIYFYDLESPEDLELLKDLNFPKTLPSGSFLFVDEIQYMDYPDKFIKLTVDHLKGRVKLIVSGSSSLKLKKKFQESLVGRKFEFSLLPLNFEEFLVFKGREDLVRGRFKISASILWPYFSEFVIYGGYPRVVLEDNFQIKKKMLSEIFTSFLQKDIRSLFTFQQPEKFTVFLRYLAAVPGGILSISTLSKELSMSKSTVYSYLDALQVTYIVYLLSPFSTNPKKEITKQPKIYFYDTGFRNWLVKNFNELMVREDRGHLLENALLMDLVKTFPQELPLGYWRDKKGNEVDFVIDRCIPVETKISRYVGITKGLKKFISKYKPSVGFIVTTGEKGEIEVEGSKINYLPPWYLIPTLEELIK
jgi:hypothetical protein